MTAPIRALTLAITLSEEELRQVLASHLAPLALLRSALATYWLALTSASLVIIFTVVQQRKLSAFKRPGVPAAWWPVPFSLWGIGAVTGGYWLGFPHPVFLLIHVATALFALAMLMILWLLGSLVAPRPLVSHTSRRSPFQTVVIAVILSDVLLNLAFYLMLTMPMRSL
jgi:hypothetical protein